MEKRINYSTGAKWEDIVGYSRAVQIGNLLEVSGTVATDNAGALVGKNDFYVQTKFIIQKIEKVLKRAGFELTDVAYSYKHVCDRHLSLGRSG
jgi:enamine deaminase RidA (YjgF/YER057c/UK114 family)